ncbi:MAG: hypothetical protein IKX58_02840, partial [Clostridia bacterium]|nr:hypothetical protein [Clostridia bacterium]
TIYKGPLPVDWMDELGSGYRYAFDYIGGDDTGIYICFGLHQKSGDGEWHYLVRYDIEGGELITSIKGRLHWAPTEENW